MRARRGVAHQDRQGPRAFAGQQRHHLAEDLGVGEAAGARGGCELLEPVGQGRHQGVEEGLFGGEVVVHRSSGEAQPLGAFDAHFRDFRARRRPGLGGGAAPDPGTPRHVEGRAVVVPDAWPAQQGLDIGMPDP